MNTTYLLAGVAIVLLGVGRLINSDLPYTAVRRQARLALSSGQAGRPGALLPVRFLRPVLTGAGLILVGAGTVAGAMASPAPGRLTTAGIVSAVLFCAGVALIIGQFAVPYLSRQPWLRYLAARLFLRKANGA
jgi:hypothetical protein